MKNIQASVQEAKKGYSITEKKTGRTYHYGKNPFYDMEIENAVFCTMFPALVADANDWNKFKMSDYVLHRPA